MQKTFTIEQIRNYLLKQDSLGDILYNLSEQNILDANKVDFDKDKECPMCGAELHINEIGINCSKCSFHELF